MEPISNAMRQSLILVTLLLLASCNHPIDIDGSGDIVAVGNGASCALEDAPCENLIVNAYAASYTANPRPGFGFLRWQGCITPLGNTCTFNIAASVIHQFWFQTVPPLRATFTPEVTLGSLSDDFAVSTDCEGLVAPPGGEVVFRFRDTTSVSGENQKQCIVNAIFFDTAANVNYLVWLDLVHVNGAEEPVFELVNGEVPIREIIATFGDPIIVGKRYTLVGVSLPGASPVSIEITWVDINASFETFTQCTILDVQAPIGTATRRKTYCPRLGGGLEIKENILVGGS